MSYCKYCHYETPRIDNMARHFKTKTHHENLLKWKLTPEKIHSDHMNQIGNLEHLESDFLNRKMEIINACIDQDTIQNSYIELRRRLARVQSKNAYHHRHVKCDCGGAYPDIPSKREKHMQTQKHKKWENSNETQLMAMPQTQTFIS